MIKGHQIYAGMPPRLREGWKRGFAACLGVAALSLMGCACDVNSAQNSLQTDQKVAQSQTAQSGELTSNFTIKGKPTKTIETPMGPREVYDPVHDKNVRSAFEKIYLSNKEGHLSYLIEQNKINPFYEPHQVLRTALMNQRKDYFNQGCLIIQESVCGSRYEEQTICDDGQCIKKVIIKSGNSSDVCSFNGETVFDRERHAIGGMFFSYINERHQLFDRMQTIEAQLMNYFYTGCVKYKSQP